MPIKSKRLSFHPQYRPGANTPFRVRVSELQRHLATGIHSSLLVVSKQLRRKKDNEPFLQVQLADATGQVEANIWNNVTAADRAFESGHVLEIVGPVTTYQNRLQIAIERLRRMKETELNLADYPPGTTGEPDEFAPPNGVYLQPGEWLMTDDSMGLAIKAQQRLEEIKQRWAASQPPPQPENKLAAAPHKKAGVRRGNAGSK